MKLKLLLFLFTFGISTSVSAEIVLYCNSELATGFIKENGIYGTTDFELKRYTIKFDDDYSRVKGLNEYSWKCKDAFGNKELSTVICSNFFNNGELFTYNKKTKRFSYYSGGVFGFIKGNNVGNDTTQMYAGTCEKF